MFRQKFAAAAAVSLVVAAVSAQAQTPTLELKLNEVNTGATSGILIDSAHTGKLIFNGTLGNFVTSLAIGGGVGSLNLAAGEGITLTSFHVTDTAAADTIFIELTETNLAGTSSSLTSFLSSISSSLPAGNTLSFSTYIDAANAAFGKSTLVTSASFTGAGSPGNSFSANPTGSATTAALFSETMVVKISAAVGTTSQSTSTLVPVGLPEPASLLPLGVGLAALGFVARRQRMPKV